MLFSVRYWEGMTIGNAVTEKRRNYEKENTNDGLAVDAWDLLRLDQPCFGIGSRK